MHDKDKLLIWGFMEEMQRSAFVEGYALLFAGAVTRVSRMESCVLIGGDLFSFFFLFRKGPIRSRCFRADLSFVILIGESQGYTASAAELRQSEPPV